MDANDLQEIAKGLHSNPKEASAAANLALCRRLDALTVAVSAGLDALSATVGLRLEAQERLIQTLTDALIGGERMARPSSGCKASRSGRMVVLDGTEPCGMVSRRDVVLAQQAATMGGHRELADALQAALDAGRRTEGTVKEG